MDRRGLRPKIVRNEGSSVSNSKSEVFWGVSLFQRVEVKTGKMYG